MEMPGVGNGIKIALFFDSHCESVPCSLRNFSTSVPVRRVASKNVGLSSSVGFALA